VPAVFVLVTIYLIGFTIYNAPFLSFLGLIVIAAGLPVYWYFSSKNPQTPTPGPALPPPDVDPDSVL